MGVIMDHQGHFPPIPQGNWDNPGTNSTAAPGMSTAPSPTRATAFVSPQRALPSLAAKPGSQAGTAGLGRCPAHWATPWFNSTPHPTSTHIPHRPSTHH